jgi:ribosomal-protein-alanine N-acetyltransferase
MHTDPDVRRYVGGRAWSVEEAVDRFRRQFLGRPRRTYGLWATILVDEGRYIGSCGLTGNRSRPHLAYYIAPSYWGQGLSTEAARAFIDIGFSRLHLGRIMADVERGNRASERILRKLGFACVGSEVLESSGRVIERYQLSR